MKRLKGELTPPTSREIQVLIEVARCGSQEAAAQKLGVSFDTVKVHLQSIRYKLGAKTSLQALWLLEHDEWQDAA